MSLAQALGKPGATKDEMVALLRSRGYRIRCRRAEPLPTVAHVDEWHNRIARCWRAFGYLTEQRGLDVRVMRRARVGWDGQRLIFPMWSDDELVAAKWRLPRKGAQMRSWAGEGRAWPLYPEPEPHWDWVLLVAGELDALRGLSAGLPVVSVTLGAGYTGDRWDAWTDKLRGLRVIVCFDNNEALFARQRTDALKAAGIEARRLDLRRLGLRTRKGDLSDYLNGGGSADALKEAAA